MHIYYLYPHSKSLLTIVGFMYIHKHTGKFIYVFNYCLQYVLSTHAFYAPYVAYAAYIIYVIYVNYAI